MKNALLHIATPFASWLSYAIVGMIVGLIFKLINLLSSDPLINMLICEVPIREFEQSVGANWAGVMAAFFVAKNMAPSKVIVHECIAVIPLTVLAIALFVIGVVSSNGETWVIAPIIGQAIGILSVCFADK